jgi:PKD repeat protein
MIIKANPPRNPNIAPTINSITVPFDPVPVNTSIKTSADVTYLGDLSTLTAEWNWGDGSTSEPQASSNFIASHAYNSAGVYTVTFTLKDKNGGIYTQKSPNCVVVYDPQGGFVTGGGWINSPAGAYVSDNTLAGKATFGFVSKYEKGATVPTGKTEFQFKVANLNFHSVNYNWLVVAGSQAKYKGTGTINGEGNYGFMLSAVDGSIDKFRIKIWDKESGNTIYDNEIGIGEDAEPSTAIGGGSIIIHKEK